MAVNRLLFEKIEQIAGKDNVRYNEPMSAHTTFKTGGPAKVMVTPNDEASLKNVIEICKANNEPYYIVGKGSNLLVSDKGIDCVVIKIYHTMDEVIFHDNDKEMVAADLDREKAVDASQEAFDKEKGEVKKVKVTAGAGIMLSKLAKELLDRGLKGFEFASGIPGTLGGAITMNAGAYGGQMADVVEKVYAIDEQGNEYELSNEEMNFAYRHSLIMDKNLIVTKVDMKFETGEYNEIKAKMDEFNGLRRQKQPLEYPSAGSTFKRPEGYFAGKLIMDAGLAGYRVGGACVSPKHCGFVVNDQKATSEDVMKVMEHVDKTVFEKYGVHLEPEVRIIGEW